MFDRIKKLAGKRSLSVKGLARELGLSQNYFYNIRDGGSMSTENLKKVADYFDVSTDYLLGREDIPEWATEQQVMDVDETLKQNKVKLLFDGVELTSEDKEQLERVIRGVLWRRIEEKKNEK